MPVTGSDSYVREKRSSAIAPHRFAVVVLQAPLFCRPMKLLARRGRSSFQAGSPMMTSMKRAKVVSPFCISHHQ
ncbi:hypothetical protein D3C71_1886670 [compost metagenome]